MRLPAIRHPSQRHAEIAVKYEPISIAMGEQKVENALATGADYIISTDLSCLMHLQGYINQKGYKLKTLHLADVLSGNTN